MAFRRKRKLLFALVLAIAVVVVSVITSVYEDIFVDELPLTSIIHTVKGIDISHHNAVPDWQKLENEGVSFVYMKATEGTTHLDRDYLYNSKAGRESNVKIGAYHFYTFGEPGREQAKHFISVADIRAGDMIPVIDVEHSAANPYSNDKDYTHKVIRELKVLEDEMHQHYGMHPIIYTNINCYRLYIENYFPNNMLWIVDLEKEPSSDIKNWRIWQFSHTGRVAGMNGHVDLNYYRYTTKEFPELLLPH